MLLVLPSILRTAAKCFKVGNPFTDAFLNVLPWTGREELSTHASYVFFILENSLRTFCSQNFKRCCGVLDCGLCGISLAAGNKYRRRILGRKS